MVFFLEMCNQICQKTVLVVRVASCFGARVQTNLSFSEKFANFNEVFSG